jgi:ATP-dependent Clp protease ATP-binding subunit ClpB
VLLDEIEKAHRDVFNVLLQVLDDGRLTDGHGRTVDFTNTIVVMTSNIGSQVIQQMTQAGEREDEIREAVRGLLTTQFLPEFLNRIDETIIFHPLSRSDMASIIDIQARHLLHRLEDRKIHVELTPAARTLLVQEGYDPAYGARPLKRTIQRLVLDPLAREVLEGRFHEGDRVLIDAEGDQIAFRRGELAPSA